MALKTGVLLAKPIVNQIIALIQRDQVEAIAAVNSDLQLIQEFHKGPRARTAWPWLTLGWRETAFEEYSEQSVQQHVAVDLVLDTGTYDSEYSQDMALDYLRVLDLIIRNAGPTPSYVDWMTPLPISQETVPSGETTPYPLGTVKAVFIMHESLEVVSRNDLEQPKLSVTMSIRFDLEEILASDASTNA